MFAKVWIPAWSTGTKKYITNWARIAIPWGTMNYGMWGTPKPGMHVWVAFEAADPQLPVVIGYHPVRDSGGQLEMPPEFDNDNHANKSRESKNRELPPEKYPKINDAWIAKSSKWGQFFLLHDKLKKVVIRGEEKIEIGELAKHNVLLGDLFQEVYNNHTHQNTVPKPGDGEKITDRELSQMVFVVHDKSEQPAQPEIQEIVIKITKAFRAAGGGGNDPIGSITSLAKQLGASDDDIQKAEDQFNKIMDSAAQELADIYKSATGQDLDLSKPWWEIIGDVANALGLDKAVNAILNAIADALKSLLPEDVFNNVMALVNDLIEGDYSAFVSALVDGIMSFLEDFLPDWLVDPMRSLLTGILNMDADAIMGALGDMLGNLIPSDLAQALMSGDWAGVVDGLANVFGDVLGAFVPHGVIDGLAALADFVLTGDFASLVQAGADLLQGAISGVLTGLGIPAPLADAIVGGAVSLLSGGDLGSALGNVVGSALGAMGGDGLAALAGALLGGMSLQNLGVSLDINFNFSF